MAALKYHIQQLSSGWIGLLAGDNGLRRATLKPTPQEVMEDLGNDVDGADHDPDYFDEVVARLIRYSEGDLEALNDIELDLSGHAALLPGRMERLPHDPAGAKRAATAGWRPRRGTPRPCAPPGRPWPATSSP